MTETADLRAQTSKKRGLLSHCIWPEPFYATDCIGSKHTRTQERPSAIQYRALGLNTDASHTGYQIRNGSKGYEIKSTLVESHGEILDDKKHQELRFLPVLRAHD